MRKPFRIGEVVHLFSLSTWFGCLAMTAASAGILFPTVHALTPVAPAFAKYPSDHWLIIAGHVGEKLFWASDAVQVVCGSIALLTFGLALAKLKQQPGPKPWQMLARAIVISIAIGLVAYQVFLLAPRMQTSLHAFWSAAEAGNVAEADKFRERFDVDHPLASSLMGATLVTVLIAWFLSAFALAGIGVPGGCCGGRCSCKKSESELETPALVGKNP